MFRINSLIPNFTGITEVLDIISKPEDAKFYLTKTQVIDSQLDTRFKLQLLHSIDKAQRLNQEYEKRQELNETYLNWRSELRHLPAKRFQSFSKNFSRLLDIGKDFLKSSENKSDTFFHDKALILNIIHSFLQNPYVSNNIKSTNLLLLSDNEHFQDLNSQKIIGDLALNHFSNTINHKDFGLIDNDAKTLFKEYQIPSKLVPIILNDFLKDKLHLSSLLSRLKFIDRFASEEQVSFKDQNLRELLEDYIHELQQERIRDDRSRLCFFRHPSQINAFSNYFLSKGEPLLGTWKSLLENRLAYSYKIIPSIERETEIISTTVALQNISKPKNSL
jgi:hypothetical protein